MKRFFAILFVSLYIYNIVGYLFVFSILQQRVRREVKQSLAATLPESDIIRFSFPTKSIDNEMSDLRFTEDFEFAYDGKLYDVVRKTTTADSTIFYCINDAQEEQLYADLDNHVQREMGKSGNSSKLDAFKDAFQDSLANRDFFCTPQSIVEGQFFFSPQRYTSITSDVPFLPPKTGFTISLV
jgi:hypothetical protein